MKTDTVLPLPAHPLDVEASVGDFAIGLAYATHLKDEAAALELLEIEAAAWTRAAAWPERIADEIGRGEQTLVIAFGAAFKATQAALRNASPTAPLPSFDAVKGDSAIRASMLVKLSNEAANRAAPELTAPSTRPEGAVASMSAPPPTQSAETEPEPWQTRAAAMPFEPNDSPSAHSAVEAPASVYALGNGPVNLDTTLEAPAVPLAATLPFGRSTADAGQGARELSIEQYASLCATLDAFPDKAAIIPQRYGIDRPHDLERVHEMWRARFTSDPAARAVWERNFREIRARLGAPK
jgi:hypothetical protein